MASAEISRHWPDGDILIITVAVEESFPDAVREAEASAKRLFSHSMDVILTADANAETSDEDLL